jgi:hypothetical protein
MQHRGNGLYRPLLIGREQHMRSVNGSGRSMAPLDEGMELTALVFIQVQDIGLGHRFFVSVREVTQGGCKERPW